MNDIQQLVNEQLEKKFQDGTVNDIISKHIDNLLNDSIKRSMDSWSDPAKLLQEKIKGIMCEAIEKYDFSQYLVKMDYVLSECMNGPLIQEHQKLIDNLQTLFTDDVEDVDLVQIFDKYAKYIEENFDPDDSDEVEWDDDDNIAYIDLTCDISSTKHWLSSNDESYEVILSCPFMKKATYKFSVNKYDFQKEYSLRYNANLDLPSIRYADKFSLYLLNLAQRDVKFKKCTANTWTKEIEVRRERD